MENLTTLPNVKSWLGVTTANDDGFLQLLINNSSRFIHTFLQRRVLFYSANSEIQDGYNTATIYLKKYPVLSVSSLIVGTQTIPVLAAGDTSSMGAILDPFDGQPPGSPQALSLRGYRFRPGQSNISIQYTSGYVIQNEPYTISGSSLVYTVNAPYGNWGADNGVTYANGNKLTPVSDSPAQGQYEVTNGIYTFAAADAGASILISYSYIPSDLEQACIELVGERYRYKNRIGEVSKSLGGQETISFSQKSMSDYIAGLLQPYQSVILC